jgi:protein phosphatase 2C family protein 2/3
VIELSHDHKPSEDDEYLRIVAGGGQVYQTTTSTQLVGENNTEPEFIVGPIRVLPGRLSVSRTFGDPEAKYEFRGGNPNVVCAKTDVKVFQI